MKRYDKLILVVMIVVFGVGIFFTARGAFESYVSFAAAAESGRNVQIKGVAIPGSLQGIDGETFSFEMTDMEGSVYRVTHTGNVPVNLFESDNVVVKGRFENRQFMAHAILVRCPSRYEAEE
ncbi:MAG: cytochrome c maturation protein CcmE [Firmicutes bacterium]|nr:cytochrome c maturation protein CcmE [Bacillota bacterium]MCL5992591.1 cytochrome c maturation protein CcmE [Bacillota bacterium]